MRNTRKTDFLPARLPRIPCIPRFISFPVVSHPKPHQCDNKATPARMKNAECRMTGQATPMRLQCDIKATPKPLDSQGIGTPMRPQSHPKATCGLSFSGQELLVLREVGLEEAQKGRVGVVHLVRGIGSALDVHDVPLPESPVSP